MLVSADFSRELTSAVMWLNEKDLDIRCVRIKPYTHNGATLIDVQQVVPLPEAANYQIQLREKKREERRARKSNIDFTRFDVVIGDTIHRSQWKRNAILLVVKHLVEAGKSPEKLAEALASVRNTVWYVVDGVADDVDKFQQMARAKAEQKGRR